ncbi:hypothetical protein RYD26_12285 [Pasteurellaceae bacterium LIM206]|nr:hypothetical protein [Pasteurellaceae bacterium LIM206]
MNIKKLSVLGVFLAFYIILLLFGLLLELVVYYKTAIFSWFKKDFLNPLPISIGATFLQIILHKVYPSGDADKIKKDK